MSETEVRAECGYLELQDILIVVASVLGIGHCLSELSQVESLHYLSLGERAEGIEVLG